VDKWLDQLESCLTRLDAEHDQLLGLVRRKQGAMRLGQAVVISDCIEREHASVKQIAEIERLRQQTVGQITGAWAPGSAAPMTVAQIAERAGEPRRGRMLMMQQRLRRTIELIRTENEVSRRATEGLLRHVQGVIRHVATAMGGSTYGRRGVVASASSTFSITG
jgi:hypothetical protein